MLSAILVLSYYRTVWAIYSFFLIIYVYILTMDGIEVPHTCLWEDIREYSLILKQRINYFWPLISGYIHT